MAARVKQRQGERIRMERAAADGNTGSQNNEGRIGQPREEMAE